MLLPAFAVAAGAARRSIPSYASAASALYGRHPVLPANQSIRRRSASIPPPAEQRLSGGGQPMMARQQVDAQGIEYIRLDGFLKIQSVCSTGGQAKMLIQDGQVRVNGETETRRGKKLRDGDVVQLVGDDAELKVEFY